MSEFFSALFGAVLGFGTGLATEWWKSGRADLRDLCKEFCKEVGAGADTGAELWLTAGSDPKVALLLARVVGYQNRLDGYAAVLVGRLDEEMLDEIDAKLAVLFQELTGGDPQDPQRVASQQRAFTVHTAASDAITAIRRAIYSRMSFEQRIYRFCGRSWVNRTRTMHLPPDNPFPGN